MQRVSRSNIIALLVIAAPFAIASPASAATKHKKLTLEQAWALCKAQVDREFTTEQHRDKYLAGGACMRRHGYSL